MAKIECRECGKEIITRKDWTAYNNSLGYCANCGEEENLIEED